MIKIHVFFYGLICHVGEEDSTDKKYSAVVTADHHVPYVNWSGNTGRPFVFKGDEVLRFHHEPSSGAADGSDPGFRDCLPHLTKLAFKTDSNTKEKGKPKKHPKLGHDHTTATGYVRYRSGRFTVATWFKEEGIYCDDGTTLYQGCVPEITLLTLEFDGASVDLVEAQILPGGHVEGPLKPVGTVASFTSDAVILVSNNPARPNAPVEPPVACGTPGYSDHWKHHLQMTDGDDIADVGKSRTTCARYDKETTDNIARILKPLFWKPEKSDEHDHHHDAGSPTSSERTAPKKDEIRIMIPGEIVCSNSGFP